MKYFLVNADINDHLGTIMRSLYIRLYLLTQTLTVVVTGAKTKLFVCPEKYLLSWQDLPPYTHLTNGTPGGTLSVKKKSAESD